MSLVADTTIISHKADMSIFVIRAGVFDKALLPEIENIYSQNKLPRVSLVLNGVKYGYGYGYGYNKSQKSDYYVEDDVK